MKDQEIILYALELLRDTGLGKADETEKQQLDKLIKDTQLTIDWSNAR